MSPTCNALWLSMQAFRSARNAALCKTDARVFFASCVAKTRRSTSVKPQNSGVPHPDFRLSQSAIVTGNNDFIGDPAGLPVDGRVRPHLTAALILSPRQSPPSTRHSSNHMKSYIRDLFAETVEQATRYATPPSRSHASNLMCQSNAMTAPCARRSTLESVAEDVIGHFISAHVHAADDARQTVEIDVARRPWR